MKNLITTLMVTAFLSTTISCGRKIDETQGLKDQITTLNTQITNLENTGTDNSETISSLRGQIARLNLAILALESDGTDETTIASLRNQIAGLNSKISWLEAVETSNTSTIDTLNSTIVFMDTIILDLNNQIDILKNAAVVDEAAIQALRDQVAILNGRIAGLETEKADLNAEFTTYKEYIDKSIILATGLRINCYTCDNRFAGLGKNNPNWAIFHQTGTSVKLAWNLDTLDYTGNSGWYVTGDVFKVRMDYNLNAYVPFDPQDGVTYGTGNILETTHDLNKDLESLGSNLESLANEELSLNLEENYGLSEERAQSVAKITSSFQKIQNKRALTAKEMNIYTQKVLGVDYAAGKKALEKHIQGDSADMDALMERAAEINGTSPEAVTELVGEYLLN